MFQENNLFLHNDTFLSIQVLKYWLQPFHLTYSLSPFFFITFSTLFHLLFFNSFLFQKFRFCARHRVFNFLIKKALSDPRRVKDFAKMFSYFEILTLTPTSNLESPLLFSLRKPIYVIYFTSTGFILIVLWYVLLLLFTMSSNLSICTIFDKSYICKFCSLRS